jgi:hypothetical protein
MSMPTTPNTRRLACGDVGVAGSDDLVDRGHGGGAVRERADRLRAADREHPVDAGDGGGGEHQRGAHAVGRGHDHHQLGHAGDLRRIAFISTDDG